MMTLETEMNLEEVCLLRSNELTRILAGCVAIDPPKILPMLERLRPAAFTDLAAKQYINSMKERLPELQAADENRQVEIGIEVAKDCHFLSDYCIWITAVDDMLTQQAEAAIKELQGITITLYTIRGLQGWVMETQKEINR